MVMLPLPGSRRQGRSTVLLSMKSKALVPDVVMLVMARSEVELLVRVATCGPLVVPRIWLPKFRPVDDRTRPSAANRIETV